MSEYWCYSDNKVVNILVKHGFTRMDIPNPTSTYTHGYLCINISDKTVSYRKTLKDKIEWGGIDDLPESEIIMDFDKLEQILSPIRRDDYINKILDE